MFVYQLLNGFFIFSHVCIILFTLFGWIFRKTRRVHLLLILLTLFSWLILGIWFGFGYCFWADWHWRIRQKLGYENFPDSFVTFLLNSATGLDWDSHRVDTMTVASFFAAVALSVYTNIRQGRKQTPS